MTWSCRGQCRKRKANSSEIDFEVRINTDTLGSLHLQRVSNFRECRDQVGGAQQASSVLGMRATTIKDQN